MLKNIKKKSFKIRIKYNRGFSKIMFVCFEGGFAGFIIILESVSNILERFRYCLTSSLSTP